MNDEFTTEPKTDGVTILRLDRMGVTMIFNISWYQVGYQKVDLISPESTPA